MVWSRSIDSTHPPVAATIAPNERTRITLLTEVPGPPPKLHGEHTIHDFDGYVWMVDQTNSAFRIDPDTGAWERYQGLTGPYAYSDMTGWGLSLVSTA